MSSVLIQGLGVLTMIMMGSIITINRGRGHTVKPRAWAQVQKVSYAEDSDVDIDDESVRTHTSSRRERKVRGAAVGYGRWC